MQAARYVMGIVHGEAKYLPDFLDYFSTKFPSAPVKMEIIGKKDIETTTMANFYSQVSRTQAHKGEQWCHRYCAVCVLWLGYYWN